jgi:hypothetical protein
MTSFQEFLHKKAEEQQQPSRRAKRDEWILAVNRLNEQITHWLHESDPEGLLEIVPLKFDKIEAGLGAYEVPGLGIGVGDPSVRVFPVARNVVGSPRILGDGAQLAGRVDITDGINKYILRRVLKDGGETWEVLDDRFGGVTPLDRSRLESILQDLLG